jgi:hypothetical protein
VFELSIGDVISGLARPLAAEIDKSPFFHSRRKSLNCKSRTVHNRPKTFIGHKQETVVALSAGDVTSGF